MRRHLSFGTLLLLGITSCTDGGQGSALAGSDGLMQTDAVCALESLPVLPDVRITSVVAQEAPVPHCAVNGVIGTETNFELLLPDAWNGKFVMGGGGGFVGVTVNTSLGYGVLQSGYATVGTDTGHRGNPLDASWALNNLERVVSFGHQAVHRTAVTAKAITSAYYERDPSRNLFFGCSRGGGQALMEAQRHPEDFDGIVAGAPAYSWTAELGGRNTWITQAMYPDPNDLAVAMITPAAQEILGNAVLEQCDVLDGVEDGILNDPTSCDFDPGVVACPTGDGSACLTPAQVTAARRIYDGFRPNGTTLWPGYPVGAEIGAGGWTRWLTGGLSGQDVGEFQQGVMAEADSPPPVAPSAHWAFGNGVMKYLIFQDEDWDYSTYDFSTFESDVAAVAQTLDATDPNLDAFRARGGKLLMFNGWRDMALTPYGTIDYYENVIERDPSADEDVRLIMLPGLDHCTGGPGPWWVNWVEEIDQWLETDTPPTEVTAQWLDAQAQPDGSRLACAWPEVLEYDGTGDPRDASSFSCVAPDA
jgi:pimeloyl-ACP methyl ester carboxylesterase